VPTLRSLGQPSLEVQGWAALVAPKGTIPNEGLARLETLLMQALATDAVKTRFAALRVEPVVSGRDETAQYLKSEGARWQQVIKARGIKADS